MNDKPHKHFVDTTRQIEELWNWLGYLTSPENTGSLLRRKIRQNSFGIDHSMLAQKKREANQKSSEFSVLQEDVVEGHARNIAKYVAQAREVFQAARSVSELASPILYYYGMLSLAKALILSIYHFNDSEKIVKGFYTHGLSNDRKTYDVKVKPYGTFPRLHDCYSTQPELYLHKSSFSLKELLSVNPDLRDQYTLTYDERSNVQPTDGHIDVDLERYEILPINGIKLHPIDSIFMTMFILSSQARYNPSDWIEQITVKKESFVLRSFLTHAERRYPNLVLNKIWNEVFLFGTAGRWA